MKIDIVAIGNSKGIRIPKAMLEQCGFTDSAEIELRDHSLVLRPTTALREGWQEKFAAISHKQETMLNDYLPTAFDEQDWEW